MSTDRRDQLPEFYIRPNAPTFIAYPLRDVEGRPCGEGNAPPESLEGVELKYKECTYPGKRRGKEMNVSALKQLVTHWKEILAVTAALRSTYARRHSAFPSTSLAHLWMFGRTAAALPAYLSRRVNAPIGDKHLPADVAAAFKALQGVFMTTEDMMWKAGPDGEPMYGMDAVIGADAFLTFTEDEEVFANPMDPSKVCSGPMHMVTEFVKVVLEPSKDAATPSVVATDHDAYLTYCSANMLIGLLHAIVRWRSREQYAAVHALLERAPNKEDPALKAATGFLRSALEKLSRTKLNNKQFPTILGLAALLSKTDGTVALDERLLRWPFAPAAPRATPLTRALPPELADAVARELAIHDALMDLAVPEFNRLLTALMKSLGRQMPAPIHREELERLHQIFPEGAL